MNKISLFKNLLLLLAAIPFSSFAEAPVIKFIENKNQWPSQVLYKADIKGGSLFLEKNTFTYSFLENKIIPETVMPKDVKLKGHAFKMNFVNSNPEVQVSGDNRQQEIQNYYIGNNPKKWGSGARLYTKVHYQELYSNIDMNVYNSEENLKYDFIVNPGGKTKNIKLNYTGPDEMHLENGHLHIQTSVGLIIEQKPYAYQVINGEKVEVACSYVLKNNTVSFEVGNYSPTLPLIIDPTLIGATYTGSFTDNRGYTATYDAAGNMYAGGKAYDVGYPTTVGAFDQTFPGFAAWAITLTKFNTNATAILWSTYLGGGVSGDDQQVHSIIVNGNNELFMAGRTSSDSFPTKNIYGTSAYTSNAAPGTGTYDIVVAKFDNTGGLLASSYLGGTSDDGVNISVGFGYSDLKMSWGDDGRSEIILDANSNVYVASSTQSTDFKTSANAYQTTLKGLQDGVLFKMDKNLTTLNYSTYIGGTSLDAAYGLKLDNSGKIYVTGGTESADFPIPVAGVINPTYGGGGLADGFIAVFDPSLSGAAQLLRSTYIGTANYDQSYLIEIDASGDLYVYGQTAGAYPVTGGVYSQNASNGGMFVHKLKGNLKTTVFSTAIGVPAGGVPLSPTAFLVDSCQTIYISGWARCVSTGGQWAAPYQSTSTGLPVTANAYQSSTDGCDLYFAVLAPDAKALWYATFYGANLVASPEHVDGGTSRFDKKGIIYHSACVSCFGNQGFPTSPGAVSSTNNAADYSQCNNAIVKFDVAVQPLAVANVVGATIGCAPFTVTFDNTGSSATNYIWDFGDGSAIDYTPNPGHTYTTPGHWLITLYAIDSIGICGYVDTALVNITVGAAPVLVTSSTNVLCNGGTTGTAHVNATGGGLLPLSYNWSPSGGTTPTASNLGAGTYIVTVKDSLNCAATGSVVITDPPPLAPVTTSTGTSCGKSAGSACVSVTGGTPVYTYSWNTPTVQVTSCANGIPSGAYVVTVTDAHGCTATGPVSVPVINGPTVTAAPFSPVQCNGSSTGSASSGMANGTGPYTYNWIPSGQTTPIATGLAAGTYTVVITDSKGCSDMNTVTLTDPTPLTVTIATTDLNCFGDSSGNAFASVSGGASGANTYTYFWTPTNQTTQYVTGLSIGTYTLLVTDANGCTTTQTSPVINQPGALHVSMATTPSNCGTHTGSATASVSGGTPAYNFQWTPNSFGNGSTISSIPAGSYTIVVRDTKGCTASDTGFVGSSVKPVAAFSYSPSLTCDGMSVQFKDESVNATSWDWNFGDGGASTAQNPTHVFPFNGTYTVTLEAIRPPCDSIIRQVINVKDLFSYAKFEEANVFTPNGVGPLENECFHPVVIDPLTGKTVDALLACVSLEVFDRWGVKMFESVGSDNCWDGNNKKDSKPALDGTYFYIAKLGGTTIKGTVALLRHSR